MFITDVVGTDLCNAWMDYAADDCVASKTTSKLEALCQPENFCSRFDLHSYHDILI